MEKAAERLKEEQREADQLEKVRMLSVYDDCLNLLLVSTGRVLHCFPSKCLKRFK
jgi:hypothetical protein